MAKPNTIHYAVAALVLGIVAVVIGLATVRYIEHGRDIRVSVYRSAATSAGLASVYQSNKTRDIKKVTKRQAEELMADGAVQRVFFVKKGTRMALTAGSEKSIPMEPKFVADENRLSISPETDELIRMLKKLDQHFEEEGGVETLDLRALSWIRTEQDVSTVVSSYPVFVGDEFVGLAGVEMLPVQSSHLLLVPGIALLFLLVALFVLFLYLLPGRFLPFGLSSLVVLVALGALLYNHNSKQVDGFLLERDLVTTRVLNQTLAPAPETAEVLDKLWTQIFREPASGVEILPAGQAALGGLQPVIAMEGALVAKEKTVGRTLPPLIAVFVVLLIGFLTVRGLAEVVWGMRTMPGAYAYVAPAMIGMTVLVLVPFLMGIALGFFNMNYEFVGFENFHDILFPTETSDTNFYFTLGVTVFWTVSNVVLHVVIGLFMALILVNPKVRFKGLFRVLLIIPWAVPNYITALIWKWMFTSEIGALSIVFSSLGIGPDNWLGNSFWSNYFANLATNVWLGFPFMMVVSMGALQSIPKDLYEAADIDGASRWSKFWNITLPLLKPALFPAVILGSIWTFNMFNVIYLVSRGNPDNKTNILITEAYRFFNELNQYGIAAAYCVLIFVILLLYTLVTNRVTKATEGAFE